MSFTRVDGFITKHRMPGYGVFYTLPTENTRPAVLLVSDDDSSIEVVSKEMLMEVINALDQKYLGGALDAVRPILEKNGITIPQAQQ